MKRGLLRFFTVVIIVLTIVVGIDVLVGKVMHLSLQRIGSEGQLGKTNYTLYEVDAPIVIIGSSRASHHYDSKIIADSIGKGTYNAGRDGCFFTHNCCVINTILDRYTPEIIVWEFSPFYLCEDAEDPVTSMYPYYGELDYVTDVLNDKIPTNEKIKLKSNIYRYNSLFLRVLTRVLLNRDYADLSLGYEPLAPKELLTPLVLSESKEEVKRVDNKAVMRFVETLKKAKSKGTKVLVVNSPRYEIKNDVKLIDKVVELCATEGAVYVDKTSLFNDKPEFFNDITHMNLLGTEQYTKDVIEEIKNTLKY